MTNNNFLCPSCGNFTFIKQSDFPFMCCGVVYVTLDDFNKTLIGTKLESIFKRIGIPPCIGCGKRRDWINQLHLIMKGKLA